MDFRDRLPATYRIPRSANRSANLNPLYLLVYKDIIIKIADLVYMYIGENFNFV